MRSGTKFESGDVLLISFPSEDLPGARRRPVLVVSNAQYNQYSDELVCCGITSDLGSRSHSVVIGPSDMVEGKLPVRSRIKYYKLFTLDKGLVERRLGRINAATMQRVRSALLSLFG